jgi:hypothetical protein
MSANRSQTTRRKRVDSLEPTVRLYFNDGGKRVVHNFYHYTFSDTALERQQVIEYENGIPAVLDYTFMEEA